MGREKLGVLSPGSFLFLPLSGQVGMGDSSELVLIDKRFFISLISSLFADG